MVISTDAISSGDDEDDTERSEDVGADGEQISEYGHCIVGTVWASEAMNIVFCSGGLWAICELSKKLCFFGCFYPPCYMITLLWN